MSVTGYFRGHLAYYNEEQEWVYADTDASVDDTRFCPQCGKLSTEDGYDACLGYIPGVIAACCGHGINGYSRWTTNLDVEDE